MNYAKKRALLKAGLKRGKNSSRELAVLLNKDVEGIQVAIDEGKEKLTSDLINAMTHKEMNEIISEKQLKIEESLSATAKKEKLIKALGL
ncbi:MAG: hypothetical protein KAG18_03160 [Sinobacterium sp.]|nr:hypothetical protein [Sinobacterium sp.]